MNTLRVTLAVCIIGAFGGCAQRTPTAGERMIAQGGDERVAEPTPAPAASTAATAPATRPATRPAEPAVAATAPLLQPVESRPTTAQPVPVVPATSSAITAPQTDLATRTRNWTPSTCWYQNGAAIAGPVYRIMPPEARSSGWGETTLLDAAQTALSVPQMIATPIWMFITPPWTPVKYHGVEFAPSYTVDDPLPERAEKTPGLIQLGTGSKK